MTTKQEIQFWKKAIKIIEEGYATKCKTSDLDDFPEFYKNPKDVFLPQRCGSCRAKEIIDWIKGHIKLIKD